MKKLKVLQKEVLTFFSKEALESLKKNKFNGTLVVHWKNGIINDFNLKTAIRFFIRNRREEEDMFFDDF